MYERRTFLELLGMNSQDRPYLCQGIWEFIITKQVIYRDIFQRLTDTSYDNRLLVSSYGLNQGLGNSNLSIIFCETLKRCRSEPLGRSYLTTFRTHHRENLEIVEQILDMASKGKKYRGGRH